VRDAETLARIRSLAVPPAWEEVWISPVANGHVQATARDAKGRKQYRYHPRWREVRDETKYHRMIAFARAMPRMRARVEAHLGLPGLPREKVLATVVRLLETTLIRVGNEEYARANRSYGLTTLENRHVDVTGSKVSFHFRGKSGVSHAIDVRDRHLARIVKRCQDLPGHELFRYVDAEGEARSIESTDVNAYVHGIAGHDFTAKDFRTWSGTVLAATELVTCVACASRAQAKRNVVEAIKRVASRLGNTPSVCRKCYVHPAIVDGYMDGGLVAALARRRASKHHDPCGLRPEERAVVAFLEERARAEAA
jgi:DNA topoisomerase-1